MNNDSFSSDLLGMVHLIPDPAAQLKVVTVACCDE
jgi:hypothetical protein